MQSLRRSAGQSTTSKPQKAKKSVKNNEGLFVGLQTFNVSPNEAKKCVLLTYERRFNSRGEIITLQSSSRSEFDEEMEMEDESLGAALVLKRYYNIRRDLDSTQLKINSPHIRAALKTVVVSYPGVSINSEGPILLNDAPWCLFHYREELSNYASKLRDEEGKAHLKFCLQYVGKVLQKEIESFNMVKLENSVTGLEFENLWMAFKPGMLLYSKIRETVWICRFKQMNKLRNGEDLDGPPIWGIVGESLCCDGKNLRFCAIRSMIHNYHGYKSFTELKIFPLHYHPDYQSLGKQFQQRGKKVVSLLDVHHCMYDGTALMTSYSDPNKNTPCKIRGRIIVDHNEGPSLDYDFIPNTKTVQIDLDEHFRLSDDELMICAPLIPGFVLATKRWGFFDVSILETVNYNKAAFESLVLPLDVKTTLNAVIKRQGIEEPQFDDVIAGKGRGLIILLHGCPGVGKTFTAESIADYSERPLYALSKVDFGHPFLDSPEKVLTTALDRAAKWKAIVLLDEADVFMQERSMTEMSRNEQVSILLRTLEYFEGIMFLTTNRVQTIDSAFKSRIHLSLAYPTLSTTARRKIWETFILKAAEHQRPRWLTKKFLDNVSKEELNGREIKNIVRVAHALALSGKRSMQKDDLLHGLQSQKNFERDFSQAVGKKRLSEDERDVSSSKHQKVAERQ